MMGKTKNSSGFSMVIMIEMITGRLPIVQVGDSEMDLVRWIQLCIEEKKPLSDVLDPYLAEDADLLSISYFWLYECLFR